MSERGVRPGCRPGSASSLLWRRRAAKGEGSSGRSGLTALPLAVSGAGAEWRGFPGLGRGRARAGGPRGPRGRVWAPGDKGARKARGWGPRRKVGEGPNGGSQLCGEGPWTLGAPGPERGQAGRGSGSEGIGEGDGLRGRRDWGLRGGAGPVGFGGPSGGGRGSSSRGRWVWGVSRKGRGVLEGGVRAQRERDEVRGEGIGV